MPKDNAKPPQRYRDKANLILRFIKFGFSVADLGELEKMDVRLNAAIHSEIGKAIESDRIAKMLHMAQAVQMGNMSVIKNTKFDGPKVFDRWFNSKKRRLLKLAGKKTYTVFDGLTRKSGRF